MNSALAESSQPSMPTFSNAQRPHYDFPVPLRVAGIWTPPVNAWMRPSSGIQTTPACWPNGPLGRTRRLHFIESASPDIAETELQIRLHTRLSPRK